MIEPNAFKVRQFTVVLENEECDPIFRIQVVKTNPLKICEAEKIF